jgi:hypothetical protein
MRAVYEGAGEVAKERPIEELMAISVDATKLRERGEEQLSVDGKRSYPTEWRDVKVGAVSSVGWDEKRQEAFCRESSYVGGIEHADLFFKRLTVEIMRRSAEKSRPRMVFIADGAKWIWDRFKDIAPADSVMILDFYHAGEHVSELCKQLYGEQTSEYWEHFTRWKTMLWEGGIERFLAELRALREAAAHSGRRDYIQGQLNYFSDNKERMHYGRYRAEKLPIGSGTIESACKNVIGGRMKQGGMTWSRNGADAMVQIRSSMCSGRHLEDFIAALDRAA